jgi:hypothetical protein
MGNYVETVSENRRQTFQSYLDRVINASGEIYHAKRNPVKILDLATGANEADHEIIKGLVSEKINYEFVCSDISPDPDIYVAGYKILENQLPPRELEKVKFVLADARNLKKQLKKVPLWKEGKNIPVKKVLQNPECRFLRTGHHEDGRKKVSFGDLSFDLVIGCIPYLSINTGPYDDAISESARVLNRGGYHIVYERGLEKINLKAQPKRDVFSVDQLKKRNLKDMKRILDQHLTPVEVVWEYPVVLNEAEPGTVLRAGDVVQDFVLVHIK